MGRTEYLFGMCLAVSSILHGTVWHFSTGVGPTRSPPPPTRRSAIRIRLVAVERPEPPPPSARPDPQPVIRFEDPEKTDPHVEPKPKPIPEPVLPREPTSEPEPQPDPRPKAPAFPPVARPAAPPSPEPDPAPDLTRAEAVVVGPGGEQLQRTYWDDVRSRIAGGLRYPPTARRGRREGRVTLRITIDANGQIRDLSELSEIGDPALGRAVLLAARQAAPFPPPPPEALVNAQAAAELTIRFQLTR